MDNLFKNSGHVKKNIRGFSLIELIVVLSIISILFVAIGVLFNPLAQLNKSKNATRQQDLNQIKNALDAYFNDTGCYPTSLSFGNKWSSGTTVYMQKVPEDPDCSASNLLNCYDYQTDGSSCPQWNILYAQMHQPIAGTIPQCMLKTVASCLPQGGILSYNYCMVSGKLDCSYLSQNAIPTPAYSIVNTPGPTSQPLVTPTPTPNVNCNGQLSACSNGICNVEAASQCTACGGSMHCYNDLMCGGVNCSTGVVNNQGVSNIAP